MILSAMQEYSRALFESFFARESFQEFLDDADYHLEASEDGCLDKDEDAETEGLSEDMDGSPSASGSSYISDQSFSQYDSFDDESDSCSSSSSFTDVQLSDEHARLASYWIRFLATVHAEFLSCAEIGLRDPGFAQVLFARINSSRPGLGESAAKQLLFLHNVEFGYNKVSFLVMLL